MTLLTRLDPHTRTALAAALGLPDDADLAALVAEAERLRASERRASSLSGQVRILEGDLERAHLEADTLRATLRQRIAEGVGFADSLQARAKRCEAEYFGFVRAVGELVGAPRLAHRDTVLGALKLRLESTCESAPSSAASAASS